MKRLIFAVFLLFVVIITGTIGYILIEKWNFLDSIYMTIITIATVGFHEVGELTLFGRIFTIGLIIMGIGIVGYTIANLSAFIIEGDIRNLFKERKMMKQIVKLKNHIIVCGYGKTGLEIIQEFEKFKKNYLIIEKNEQKADELKNQGHLVLLGDATDDMILEKAGVKQADGLIATLSNDADNVYIVLTARGMNPDIRIIAQSIDAQSCKKLLHAGANKIVSPYTIAGRRMARLLLTPGIVNFLEVMVQNQEIELKIEEIYIQDGSSLTGKMLKESNIKAETDGAHVIGIKKGDDKIIINPQGDTVLQEGNTLYALGNNLQIMKLQTLAGAKS